MKGKVLVTGSQGLVGSRFVELYGSRFELLTPELSEFDFLNVPLMKKYLDANPIDAVVNFAAYTDVAGTEAERGNYDGLVWKINVTGLRDFINLLNPESTYFIQISTDMVFTGSGDDPGPYSEDHKICDDPSKLSWYGYSKAQGEKLVSGYFDNFSILRLIAPVRAKFEAKLDFLRKHLQLYNEGKLYPLFYDQKISICYIDEICLTLEKLLEGRRGTYHASSTDTISPYELISYFIEAKYGVKDGVKKISIHDFLKSSENPTRYPVYGGLDSKLTQKKLNLRYSSSREIIDKLIREGV